MRYGLVITLTLVLLGTARLGRADDKQTERLERSAQVITEIMHPPEKGIPKDLLDKAVCIGIIPSEKKGAVGLGASYGRGAMICRRGGDGPWEAPSMFTVEGLNLGFQLGGQSTDFVLLVMNARGAEQLLHDKTKIGADASAAGGPVGRSAEGATDLQLHAETLPPWQFPPASGGSNRAVGRSFASKCQSYPARPQTQPAHGSPPATPQPPLNPLRQ